MLGHQIFQSAKDRFIRYYNSFKMMFVKVNIPTPLQKPAITEIKAACNDAVKSKPLKKDILDNLDAYFKYIKRMRKVDSKSYEFYKKLGGQVIAGDNISQTLDQWTSLPSRWKYIKPAFGCIMVQDEPDNSNGDNTYLRFLYFRKYEKNLEHIQHVPVNGDVYVVSAIYTIKEKNSDEEHEALLQYPVLITEDNECRILLMRQQDPIVIKSNRPGYRKGTYIIHRTKWALPSWAITEARIKNTTPEELLLKWFYYSAQIYEVAQQQMIEVRATKGNICARFTIKGDITADLFKEREIVGNRKKKIFHSVRPHVRSNGAKIKMHFRGERKFTWNGYSIAITVPGVDYKSYMPEMDFKGIEQNLNEPLPNDAIDEAELANILVDHMTRSVA